MEEFELEDKYENLMLTVKIIFRFNKKVIWANTIADLLYDFKMQIYNVIKKKKDHNLVWKIISTLAFIKVDIKKRTFLQQFIDDFSKTK